jgi:hypothetical protein
MTLMPVVIDSTTDDSSSDAGTCTLPACRPLRAMPSAHHRPRATPPGHASDVWLCAQALRSTCKPGPLPSSLLLLRRSAKATAPSSCVRSWRSRDRCGLQGGYPCAPSPLCSPPFLCTSEAQSTQATAQQLTALEVALAGIVATTRARPATATVPVDGGPGGAGAGLGAHEVADAQKWHAVARWATTDSVTAAATGDVPGGWAANHRRCVGAPRGACAPAVVQTLRLTAAPPLFPPRRALATSHSGSQTQACGCEQLVGIRAQLELAQAAVVEAGERARAADDRAAKAAAAAAARVAAAEHDTSAARQRADHCAVELAGARRRAREAQGAAEGSVTALQTALAASQRAADAAVARASTAERRCGTLTAALAKARAEAQQAGEAATQAAQHARAELDAAWAELAAVRSDSGAAEQLRCQVAEAVAAREAAQQQVEDMRAALALTAQQAEQWRARAQAAVNAAQEAVEAARQAQVDGATAAAEASVAAAQPATAAPPACDAAAQTDEQAPVGEGAASDAEQPPRPEASFVRLNPAVLAALRRRRRRAARAHLARAMAYARAHGPVRAVLESIEAADASTPNGNSAEQQAATALLEASCAEVESLRVQLEAAASAQGMLQEQLRTAASAAHRASHRANAAEHRARAVVADAASLAAVEAALVSARQQHTADDAAGSAAQQHQHQLLTDLRAQVTDLQAKLEATLQRAQEAESVAAAATARANAPASRGKPAPSAPASPVDGALERLAATWRAACASRDEAALQATQERDDALAALAAARTSGGSAAEIAALRLALRTRERDVTELSRMLKAWEAMRASKDGALRAALDRATAAEREASDARAQLEAMRRAASRGILVSPSGSSDKENTGTSAATAKATSVPEVSSAKPLRTLSGSLGNSISAMR